MSWCLTSNPYEMFLHGSCCTFLPLSVISCLNFFQHRTVRWKYNIRWSQSIIWGNQGKITRHQLKTTEEWHLLLCSASFPLWLGLMGLGMFLLADIRTLLHQIAIKKTAKNMPRTCQEHANKPGYWSQFYRNRSSRQQQQKMPSQEALNWKA